MAAVTMLCILDQIKKRTSRHFVHLSDKDAQVCVCDAFPTNDEAQPVGLAVFVLPSPGREVEKNSKKSEGRGGEETEEQQQQ